MSADSALEKTLPRAAYIQKKIFQKEFQVTTIKETKKYKEYIYNNQMLVYLSKSQRSQSLIK